MFKITPFEHYRLVWIWRRLDSKNPVSLGLSRGLLSIVSESNVVWSLCRFVQSYLVFVFLCCQWYRGHLDWLQVAYALISCVIYVAVVKLGLVGLVMAGPRQSVVLSRWDRSSSISWHTLRWIAACMPISCRPPTTQVAWRVLGCENLNFIAIDSIKLRPLAL